MNNLLWMLETSEEVGSLQTSVENLWSDTILPIVNIVIWILVAVLAVVFIIKAVLTGLAVMKAADDPQARQEKINGFKYLAIGLGVAIVVLTLANVIMKLVTSSSTEITG
jgi:hypothetical protein